MPNHKVFTWSRVHSVSNTFQFDLSPKLTGKVKRKGLWSADGHGEVGPRKWSFRSTGKANMSMSIIEDKSHEEVGKLDFYWKDFQKSKLVLKNGSTYYFSSQELLRGVWSWVREGQAEEQFTFSVDTPFHRGGTIESAAREIPAEERDILLFLGLHLQHYINIWLITLMVVIIVVVSGP